MKNSRVALKVLRFGISGSIAALSEFLIFILCSQLLALPIFSSQTISFMIGLLISYTLNRQWVFKSTAKMNSQIMKYATLAVINLLLSNILIVALHDAGLVAWIAKIIVMASVALWNFLIFQKIIFKN